MRFILAGKSVLIRPLLLLGPYLSLLLRHCESKNLRA